MGFWSAVLLPLLLCVLVFIGFLNHSEQMAHSSGMELWFEFAGIILGIMGSFILPMLIVFIAYSVNNIEHRSETWKSLFSLPISKLSVYSAKYFYAFFLTVLCLILFVLFTLGLGNLLGMLKPSLKFSEYNVAVTLSLVYLKFLLSSLGILSIQFILSLLFRDFLKPMGIGFVCVITGNILAGPAKWQYAYLFPYSHPAMVLQSLHLGKGKMSGAPQFTVDMFTKETWVSIIVSVAVFILGYFIVLKKSVK